MATWETLPFRVPQLLPQQSRPEGLHLTDVLKRIMTFNASIRGIDEPYVHNLHAESGNEWEWLYTQRLQAHYPGRYYAPGCLKVDIGNGIPMYLTPDLVELSSPSPGHKRVIDIKWTTKSTRNWDPREEDQRTWYIRSQLMCYCKVLDTPYGGFIIRYDRGNYADKQIDQLEVNVTFEQWELDSLWIEVIETAKTMATQS